MAEKSISQKSSDDSASKAVVSGPRAKGSGGVFAIRPGVWRVDIELPRDKVTGKRRRVSRYIEGARSVAEVELSRLRVADNEKRLPTGGTSARSVRAALDLYLDAADTGLIELAQGELEGHPGSILVERYPELKANTNALQLQEEVTATENKVGFARQFYNDSVLTYNNRLQSFPTVLIAGPLKFTKRDFFEVESEAERAVPKVSFS